MNNRNGFILVLLFASMMFSATAMADRPGLIYLVNMTTSGQTIIGQCDGSEMIDAAPGEHPHCHSGDVVSFKIGLAENSLFTLDVTQEGNFSKTLSDGSVISGALETVYHLAPSVRSYYVYVWMIEGGGK